MVSFSLVIFSCSWLSSLLALLLCVLAFLLPFSLLGDGLKGLALLTVDTVPMSAITQRKLGLTSCYSVYTYTVILCKELATVYGTGCLISANIGCSTVAYHTNNRTNREFYVGF